jgi:hypothetical protein
LKREKMAAKHRPPSKVENYTALLIGHLGVCEELQGQDVGTFICDFSFDRALRFSKIIGCRFMFANVKLSETWLFAVVAVGEVSEFG